MRHRAKPISGYEQTIRELRLQFGHAIAAALAQHRLSMRDLVSRCGVSRTVFYDFLGGGPPTIRLLDRLARGMGYRLSVSLVPAKLRAREASVDPIDLATLRRRGVAGMRLIEAIGQLAPVESVFPTPAQVRRAVAAASSYSDAARRLAMPQDWVRRTISRLRIPIPFAVRKAPKRISPAEKAARLARIRDGIAAGRTLASLAAEFGLTSERVRQIANQAGLLRGSWRTTRGRNTAITALISRGVAVATVAERFNIDPSQVYRIVQNRRAAERRIATPDQPPSQA